MSETKMTTNIVPNGDTLTLRHGNAPDIEKQSAIAVTADIMAPANYFLHKKDDLNLMDCYCEVNYPAHKVTLFINPHMEWNRATIAGKLTINTLLSQTFAINKDVSFTKDDFVRLIKMNRRYFHPDTDTFALVSILESLYLKIDKELRDEDNKKGTFNQQIKQTVQSDLPDTITLEAAVFYDEEPTEILCELNFEIVNNKLHLYLISPDLQEYIQREGEKKILKAIGEFEDKIPIFYV